MVKKDGESDSITLTKPKRNGASSLTRQTFTLAEQQATASVLKQVGDTVTIDAAPNMTDAYAAAVGLSARYRLDVWVVYDELRRLYGADDIPLADINAMATQIEKQTMGYEIKEEKVDVALALIKPDGFEKTTAQDGTECYTCEIVYPKDRERLLLSWEAMKDKNAGDFGFHYSPYDFDSNPEKSFFEQLLDRINLKPEQVEDICFTGALTDPAKTDFFVEYKDDKGKWRRYTPDFVIRKKPGRGRRRGTGRAYIVEIKAERERQHPLDGEAGRKALAIRKWENLNPDRLRYEMIFTSTDTVPSDRLRDARDFVDQEEA